VRRAQPEGRLTMGALAGWIAARRGAPEAHAVVPMLESLAHRVNGDAVEACIDAQRDREIVLAASFSDPASGISLSLDGAILNRDALRKELARYPLAAGSDAELLARAYQRWDKDVVRHLRGAFAFALWDGERGRLMLARDRFGEKPLYLREAEGTLYFGSELKALARAPGAAAEVDMAAVSDYLARGFVAGPRTLLKGVRKLAPGSYALWQFGRLRETRYWSPPDQEPLNPDVPADPVASFIERLEEAVQLRMQAQRPVGALLSGGFDSAAIVALMRKRAERVATFTAGFAEDKKSELAHAARIARHLGTQHHELVLASRDLVARLPELVARRDAPFSRPADAALYLLAEQAARSIGVALSGDGSDEILGGYRRHTFLRGFAPVPKRVEGLFVIPIESIENNASELREILYYEQSAWLPDNLLERTDRMTMAAALEVRAPFLDHRLAEYVSHLPDALRVRGLSTKWILRQADRRLLEGCRAQPRKAGFRIPVGELLRGEGRELLADQLRGAKSLTRAYYDAAVLDRCIDEHLAAKKNHGSLLWTLLNLEIWHRTHSAARG
jgi:asparagine synthase (glutamine-hydrolysing)